MLITWEISELDGGSTDDRALKCTASPGPGTDSGGVEPPTSVGGVGTYLFGAAYPEGV